MALDNYPEAYDYMALRKHTQKIRRMHLMRWDACVGICSSVQYLTTTICMEKAQQIKEHCTSIMALPNPVGRTP
jgi:predicted metalloenzyme YecM